MSETPRIGFVSLGCPKALVDSERILTQLKLDGYDIVPSYEDAELVVVNTCGFIDSAKAESLDAIGEAIDANGRVIVTGCMGEEADTIRARFPQVLAITGAHQYEDVVEAVRETALKGTSFGAPTAAEVEMAEAVRRYRKLLRKRMEREGY